MLTASNVERLIAPGALAVPGTVSARLSALRDEPLARRVSCNAVERALAEISSQEPCATSVVSTSVEMGNPCAIYREVEIERDGAPTVCARVIEPSGPVCPGSDISVAVMFNDAGRPVRGWHHMTRFCALGCAVVALDAGVVPIEDAACALESSIGAVTALMSSLPAITGFEPRRVFTWGEGFGGALALLAAVVSRGAVERCAVCNPFPLEVEIPMLGAALIEIARLIETNLLIGSGLRDGLAPSEACARLARSSAGEAELVIYPEHGHERINEFENRVLDFFAKAANASER